MDDGVKKAVERLRAEKIRAMQGGGLEEIERQHARGKLTARERIEALLDPGSFVELGMLGAAREDAEKGIYGDGIVTGFGRIHGRMVGIFSQDYTVWKGSFGEVHRLKMNNVMDKARELGIPMICLWDGSGGRLELNTHINPAHYSTFKRFAKNSGVIPQISAMLGPSPGNGAYGPAMTDFIFMVDGLSFVFATGPRGTKAEVGEEISKEDLGGARVHCQQSGLGDARFPNEAACLAAIRTLLTYLPSNREESPPDGPPAKTPPPVNERLNTLVPSDGRKPYDMKQVIGEIVDAGDFFEIKPEFARNILTGFARLNGHVVGILANQPLVMAGSLTIDASVKAARFVRFADCFNIPLLMLVDTTGYLPGSEQEHHGLLRHGAKLPFALAESTVPKIAVLIRKAYGGAKPAMGIDKDLGVHVIYAWPIAESGVMGARATVEVLFRDEIRSAPDPEAFFREKVAEFQKTVSPYAMAHSTFIDDIIEPSETRRCLIAALEVLLSKRRISRDKTPHGNIPL